jgi:hypothetical protein
VNDPYEWTAIFEVFLQRMADRAVAAQHSDEEWAALLADPRRALEEMKSTFTLPHAERIRVGTLWALFYGLRNVNNAILEIRYLDGDHVVSATGDTLRVDRLAHLELLRQRGVLRPIDMNF